MNAPNTRQAGLGTRFDFQQYEAGQKGGLQWYPLSGLVSGLTVTLGTVSATAVPLVISPGQCRLDGNLIDSSAAINFSIAGTGFDGPDEQVFNVYVNPTRKYPALAADPGTPAEGDIYLNVADVDWYQRINEARTFKNGAWEKYDLGRAPIGYGHNNLILGDIVNSLDATNIDIAPEKQVFLSTQYPVYVSSTPHASFRSSASFILAQVTVANTAAVVKTRVDVANI